MQKLKDLDNVKYGKMKEFYEDYLKRCSLDQIKNIDLSFCLNDSGDVLIRLKPKADFIKKIMKQRFPGLADDSEDEK